MFDYDYVGSIIKENESNGYASVYDNLNNPMDTNISMVKIKENMAKKKEQYQNPKRVQGHYVQTNKAYFAQQKINGKTNSEIRYMSNYERNKSLGYT